MGNALAFPAPHNTKEYYDRVFRRPDVLSLTTTAGEQIPACYIKPREASSRAFTMLYSHGNAEDLAEAVEYGYVSELARATGTHVFAYEYVGYSTSRHRGDTPSEEGCLRSIDAAWRYLVDDCKVPPQRIIIFGRSIGSGPTVDLASREKVEGCSKSPLDAAGVLLQSPIESGGRAVAPESVSGVISWVGYRLDLFRNYEKIDRITAPVAIMHGTADKVVPVQNGKNLFGMLQQQDYAPEWMEGYGHNDMPQARCFAYARKFVEHLERGQR